MSLQPPDAPTDGRIGRLARDLRSTRLVVRIFGVLLIVGGLLFMVGDLLLAAASGGTARGSSYPVALICIVDVTIGIGLVRARELARQAGGVWFLATGVFNVALLALTAASGRLGAYPAPHTFGLSLNGPYAAAIQLLCAAVLLRARTAFAVRYLTAPTSEGVQEALIRALDDDSAAIRRFARRCLASVGVTADDQAR